MKWSFRLGRFAGIDVFVHITFVLLICWLAGEYWQAWRNVAAVSHAIIFLLAFFACVLLHEFGHALTARRFGIETRDIILLPIGGLARLDRLPAKPGQELLVALAGPAVNLAIAVVLLGLLGLRKSFPQLAQLGLVRGPFEQWLLLGNLIMCGFNLLPAFPMDGGRVLRALLATRVDYAKATQIAAGVGQFIAVLFAFAGVFKGHYLLLFIAFFVWIGASQETSVAALKSNLEGIVVDRAMVTEFRALSPTDRVGRAVEFVLASGQQDFPVVTEERVVGILTRESLVKALRERGETALVLEVMERDFQVAETGERLETALGRADSSRSSTMPVLREGKLVGLLTAERVGEFVMIQTALESRRSSEPPRLPA